MSETETVAPAVIERARRAAKPRRHRLEENPPPPMRAFSIQQIEAEHPGIKGRLRQWIHRADAKDPAFTWLSFCIIRVGRSVLIDEVRFRDSLYQRTAFPAAPSRRADAEAEPDAAKGGAIPPVVSAQKSATGKKGRALQLEAAKS